MIKITTFDANERGLDVKYFEDIDAAYEYVTHLPEEVASYDYYNEETGEEVEDIYIADIVDDYEDWSELDDGFLSNCHCDSYGICGGYSCSHYFQCQA